MNKVILIGRLTKDPDVRYSQTGNKQLAIARYTLAVDRKRKVDNQPSADFISCVSFDRGAEFAEKYFRKGSKIGVVGHIQTGSYTNAKGDKVYTTDVMVEEHEFVESKTNSEPRPYGEQNYQERPSFGQPQPAPSGEPLDDGFYGVPEGVDDEGLPFN